MMIDFRPLRIVINYKTCWGINETFTLDEPVNSYANKHRTHEIYVEGYMDRQAASQVASIIFNMAKTNEKNIEFMKQEGQDGN